MENSSLTTAAIIRFSEELEENSSAFYENLAERWVEQRDAFLTFAGDGKKNKTQVVRTYQETISDALEASYSFEGLNLKDYKAETTLVDGASYVDDLRMAIALEEIACAFYLEVARRGESLLATIPRAFKRVAKRRGKRQNTLESMLYEAQAHS
jgi:rubrerythrin